VPRSHVQIPQRVYGCRSDATHSEIYVEPSSPTVLGVRLLNRTHVGSGLTEAGGKFYRHAVTMLREAY
jgi:hypothetical protein